jgi:hypothetical protein
MYASLHHNVHPWELRPHLKGRAKGNSVQNVGFEQVKIWLRAFRSLVMHLLSDFLELKLNELVHRVTVAMQVSQYSQRLCLSCEERLDTKGAKTFLNRKYVPMVVKQPSRRLGEDKHHADRKYDGRNYLQAPWNPEWRDAIHVRATELYEILNEDTPCDRPLLNRDEATADWGCSDFWLIERDNCRCDTHGDAGDNSASDKHPTVLYGGSRCVWEDEAKHILQQRIAKWSR